mgnify:CR=1 FL=1
MFHFRGDKFIPYAFSASRAAIIPFVGIYLEYSVDGFSLLLYSVWALGFRIIPFHYFPGAILSVSHYKDQMVSKWVFGLLFALMAALFGAIWYVEAPQELSYALFAAQLFISFNVFVGLFQGGGIRYDKQVLLSIIQLFLVLVTAIAIGIHFQIGAIAGIGAVLYISYRAQRPREAISFREFNALSLAAISALTYFVLAIDKLLVLRFGVSMNQDAYSIVSYASAVMSIFVSGRLIAGKSSSFQVVGSPIYGALLLLIAIQFGLIAFVQYENAAYVFPLLFVLVERVNFPVMQRIILNRPVLLANQLVLCGLLYLCSTDIVWAYLDFNTLTVVLLLKLFVPVISVKIQENVRKIDC